MILELPFFAAGAAMLMTRYAVTMAPRSLPALTFLDETSTEASVPAAAPSPVVDEHGVTFDDGPTSASETTTGDPKSGAPIDHEQHGMVAAKVNVSVPTDVRSEHVVTKLARQLRAVVASASATITSWRSRHEAPVVDTTSTESPDDTRDDVQEAHGIQSTGEDAAHDVPAFLSFTSTLPDSTQPVPSGVVADRAHALNELAALYEIEVDELPHAPPGSWAQGLTGREVSPTERFAIVKRLVALKKSIGAVCEAIKLDHEIRPNVDAWVLERLPREPELYATIARRCNDEDLVSDEDGSLDVERSDSAIAIATALADRGYRRELLAMIVDGRTLSQTVFGFLLAGSDSVEPLTADEVKAIYSTVGPEAAEGFAVIRRHLLAPLTASA